MHEIEFENVVCKMASILSRRQFVGISTKHLSYDTDTFTNYIGQKAKYFRHVP